MEIKYLPHTKDSHRISKRPS